MGMNDINSLSHTKRNCKSCLMLFLKLLQEKLNILGMWLAYPFFHEMYFTGQTRGQSQRRIPLLESSVFLGLLFLQPLHSLKITV